MDAHPVTSSQDFTPLRYRIRMVECTRAGAREVQTVADFENEAAAEAFIRMKIAAGPSADSSAGRHWGKNAAGDQICYWIETDQETASVKAAHAS
jgi:hypothetical protein